MSRSLPIAVVALAMLLPLSAANAQIDRGPYIQIATPDSMVVAWRTAAAADSRVCYGARADALTSMAMGAAGVRQHEVRISGLVSSTRYYYRAGAASCPPAAAGDSSHYFVTAPPTGTAPPLRFWIVGDSGTGGLRQQQVTDAMLAYVGARRPDLYVHVGDMAYSDGTTSEFDDNFYAMYQSVLENVPVWPAIGNHEGHTSDSATETGPYYDGYVLPRAAEAGGLPSGTEAYYSFDWGSVHFIVLDSYESPRSPGGAMLTWLTMDLAATAQEWIVAYWHHPAYTKGSHDSDGEGELIDMRENALPILEAGGVDIVLAGHSHIYERSYLIHGAYDTPTTAAGHVVDMGDGQITGDGAYDMGGDGALYITAGHGGTGVSGAGDHPVMYFSEVRNGSVIADITGPAATLTNITWDGVESDHVDLMKVPAGDGIFVTSPAGGERYLVGSTVPITWSSTGDIPMVSLEFSLDGGMFWAPIIGSTENDGSYEWVSPENPTINARVRVASTAAPGLRDESGDFELSASAEVTVIPFGGTWEYFDTGVDQGDAWRTTTGGGWASGMAQLGYGDGDEATTLLDADPNVPTVYFRQGVRIEGEVTGARFRSVFDDGIAIFINGTQVAAQNVGATDFAAFAAAGSMDNETLAGPIDLTATNPFIAGDNVIGAIVKQSDGGSSDLSFDFELIIETVRTDLEPIPWPPGGSGDAGTPGTDGSVPGRDGGGTPARDAGPGSTSVDAGCGCVVPGPTRTEPSGLVAIIGLAALGLISLRSRRARRGRKIR